MRSMTRTDLSVHMRSMIRLFKPGRVAQSERHLRYPVWQHTFVSSSADERGAVVSYWRKFVHEVLVNRLGALALEFLGV